MRPQNGCLGFAPRLPSGITRLAFRLCYRARRIAVTVTAEEATYELLDGPAMCIVHYGEQVAVEDKPITRSIPPVHAEPRPSQPPGREPVPRAAAAQPMGS